MDIKPVCSEEDYDAEFVLVDELICVLKTVREGEELDIHATPIKAAA